MLVNYTSGYSKSISKTNIKAKSITLSENGNEAIHSKFASTVVSIVGGSEVTSDWTDIYKMEFSLLFSLWDCFLIQKEFAKLDQANKIYVNSLLDFIDC